MPSVLRFILKTAIAVCILITTIAPQAHADNAGHKFVRGIGNILSGWLEIPLAVYTESLEETPLVGMTLGLAKGVGKTIARTCAGVYETFTFPFAFPEDYKPLMEPEFVFQKEV